jgi:hypothetical protein
VIDAAADARDGTGWSDVTFIHGTRWQDEPLAQISYGSYGYPKENRSKAWEIWRDRGVQHQAPSWIRYFRPDRARR